MANVGDQKLFMYTFLQTLHVYVSYLKSVVIEEFLTFIYINNGSYHTIFHTHIHNMTLKNCHFVKQDRQKGKCHYGLNAHHPPLCKEHGQRENDPHELGHCGGSWRSISLAEGWNLLQELTHLWRHFCLHAHAHTHTFGRWDVPLEKSRALSTMYTQTQLPMYNWKSK